MHHVRRCRFFQATLWSVPSLSLRHTHLRSMHPWIPFDSLQRLELVMYPFRFVFVMSPWDDPLWSLLHSLNVSPHPRRHLLLIRHLLRPLTVFCLRKMRGQSHRFWEPDCRSVPSIRQLRWKNVNGRSLFLSLLYSYQSLFVFLIFCEL